jgi:hypothetical protein
MYGADHVFLGADTSGDTASCNPSPVGHSPMGIYYRNTMFKPSSLVASVKAREKCNLILSHDKERELT